MLFLLPFLFATYLVLEAVEAHAGGALEGFLARARSIGPFAGGLAGAVPQCGVSAAAASLYAGGVITVGTLLAVFLATSDELLPVLVALVGRPVPEGGRAVTTALLGKILVLKVVFAIVVGYAVNGVFAAFRHMRREVSVRELCAHSRCGCHEHRGILVPALIHTGEIFLFILLVSGALEIARHFFGADLRNALPFDLPVVGECVAGLAGLVPNCAVSVVAAELYASGAMSPAALMASSFTGSGLGLLVLFRTNRSLKENLAILATVYLAGVLLGLVTGPFIS